MNEPSSVSPAPDRLPRRVRHELRFRKLEVRAVQRITPHLIRITLGGDDLAGFNSPGFDDHAKLFFPDPATGQLTVPTSGPEGPVWPPGQKPAMRDYTPRRHDSAAGTLEIDFALHDAGPATQWAESVRPGEMVGVGGPRGSFIIPTAFDWHLLVGDDTALPAISRRLAELPAGSRAVVLAEVDSEADEIPFETQAALELRWVHRRGAEPGTGSPLLDALRGMQLPEGDFHAWVACESGAAKTLRSHLVGERGAHPKWVKAAGYWRRGSAATHDTHDD
ncbi:siderophore-interacting protein [Variovorax saccharolyticus]|uniref:siderophore-interacting protein n=1 Tax=Variovorax saccharolyticus TaxID=3053516 RepID=UPI002578F5D9|nr:siderophore-interacting protein [Variovorax sp. J22R187]MDM0022736.1 siderophore-interacting protein [Variovorax sp. J22R187]